LLLAVSLFLALDAQPGRAQDPTPEPGGMVAITDMMVPPPLPENPTQADYGQQTYYYVCMACHGDRGQGLSPEWIEEWDLEPNACWQSKCHASNHPPDGFILPHTIPGVVGAVLTDRFGSALDLYTYIKAAMPWHAPGTLKDEEYWNVTAFLLRLNELDEGVETLDAARAAQIVWRTPPAVPTPVPTAASAPAPVVWLAAGVVLAGLGAGVWVLKRRVS
jgi:hypothetical protein